MTRPVTVRLKNSRIRGVSLIELMVSVAIGMFLVIGATTVYVNSRKTSDVDESIARLEETARYAMSIIETDVRMSNYWGLQKNAVGFINKVTQANAANPADKLVTGTGAADCGDTYAVNVEVYAEATNNKYDLKCDPTKKAAASADTLTVRRTAIPSTTADATRLQVCTTRTTGEIIKGGACAGEIHNLLTNIYYVSSESDQSTSYPSLRHKMLGTQSLKPSFNDDEIIPGIEDMQVQFAWNSGSSAQATQYVNPDSGVLATGQIVAVRVWLLVRAETPDASYTDTRTYEYADRSEDNGVTSSLDDKSATKAYKPNDHYRRLLVSRTFFIRNAVGT